MTWYREKQTYVVVVMNSNLQVGVFGTPTGRAFRSEKAAEKAAKRIEERYPHLNGAVAVSIDESPKLRGG